MSCSPQAALLQSAVRGYASKDVRFGIECRDAVLGGVNKLADAVQVTLGPKVCTLWLRAAPPLSAASGTSCPGPLAARVVPTTCCGPAAL